jgi:hypothetical protein
MKAMVHQAVGVDKDRDGELLTDANVLSGGNVSGGRLPACPRQPQSLAKP